MHYQLMIQAQYQPEVVERVLRVVRHRGFQLVQMQMIKADDDQVRLNLAVESERPLSLLYAQLNKLPDVAHVEHDMISAESQQMAWA